jgi:lipid A 3-O-deacylase
MRHSRKIIGFSAADIMTARRIGMGLLFWIVPTAAAAQNWTTTLISENDAYFNIGDRHYTNGLYLSLTTPPRAGNAGFNHRYSFFLGQSIFTPQDLLLDSPDPDDRPYAGWLYAGVRMYRESTAVLDRFDISLGVVGPSSGAEAVQSWFHALNMFGGSVKPRGWASQLHDEPAAVLSAQRTWRVTLTEGFLDGELLPEANLALGNVFTYAGVGTSLRVGLNLRADWGAPRIQPALQGSDFVDRDAAGSFAWYIFAGIEGRAIARNIFLDGNTWKDSPSVSRETFVADYNLGLAVIGGPFAVRLSYTERTREFETQRSNDKFGSLNLSLLLGG